MKPTRRLSRGLIVLCLTTLFSACAQQPIVSKQAVSVYTPVYVPLDPSLTAAVDAPAFPKKTPLLNRDLANYLLDLRMALDTANKKLDTIRSLQPAPKAKP